MAHLKAKDYPTPQWNIPVMVNLIGLERDVAKIFSDAGFNPPPPLSTITGWRQRKSMPGSWALLLASALLKAGLVPDNDLSTFLVNDQKDQPHDRNVRNAPNTGRANLPRRDGVEQAPRGKGGPRKPGPAAAASPGGDDPLADAPF